MKSKKIILVIMLITCCCISCKRKVSESLQILILNRTDSVIHIQLYPKKTAPKTNDLYPPCEGCGVRHNTEFTIAPSDGIYSKEMMIFYTDNLNMEPYILAEKAFDSIYISTANKDSVIIKFTHENATGYSENIFSENSTWDFEIVEETRHSQLRGYPLRFYQYKFLISKDKIINKKGNNL